MHVKTKQKKAIVVFSSVKREDIFMYRVSLFSSYWTKMAQTRIRGLTCNGVFCQVFC